MELVERADILAILQTAFNRVAEGEGHCVFISGEAGIGKTALVKAFSKQQKDNCIIYQGACDALFTPRPLAPLYDIVMQLNSSLWTGNQTIEGRSELFANFFHELRNQNEKILIVFEDIHWADEATLDFIKFFSRRIVQLPCLFILTYRDNEVNFQSAHRNMLSDLSPDTFTRIQPAPLSRQAVYKLATEKGYDAEHVYNISGGNPFYVNEILASYSPGVPDNIKDAILAVYDRQEEGTKNAWQITSVIPEGLEVKRFAKIRSSWDKEMDHCFAMNVIIVRNGKVVFKHELYRMTIEQSLSPFKRISLNKTILDLFLESFEAEGEIERIVQYAKNAAENKLVVKYAPLAAKQAACIGAHVEASKLFLVAIEYSDGNDTNQMVEFYEAYAYECYLTNQINEAIIHTGKSLEIWERKNNTEKIANSLRILSRLWWLNDNRENAESFARQAVDVIENQPSSSVKAMAFSNMSQLKMLSDQSAECIAWGEKAITVAQEVKAEEALSHALNNVGSELMNSQPSRQKGIELLQQSLEIALTNSFHEHAARAYSNLASNAVKLKDYVFAKETVEVGIQYCEKRDLDSWRLNMLSLKAFVNLETGDWDEAYSIADNLLKNEDKPRGFKITALLVLGKIKMRTGKTDALPLLLEAEARAFKSMELQRIIPSLIALLEYEWLTAKPVIKTEDLDQITGRLQRSIYTAENNELAFWLLKARKQSLPLSERYEGYEVSSIIKAQKAAALWRKSGCNYAQAFALLEGTENDQKAALLIFQQLGADAVYEKVKMEMRARGIKNIPRGLRESTKTNPAQLTNRELDVLQLLQKGIHNKEIADTLYISPKTADHHISSILFKLDVNSRLKAVTEAVRLGILK